MLLKTQSDPYWLENKSATIAKCRGSKEDLGVIILGRLELDYFRKVDHVKETKHRAL